MKLIMEVDPSDPAEIEQARRFLDSLAPVSEGGQDGPFIALWTRIGENAAEFLRLAKKHTKPGESFTFESLAAASQVPADTLKAWHRNLSRTMNSLGSKAPVLFSEKWDGQRQNYTLTDEARAAI